jgi:hypothetical protein
MSALILWSCLLFVDRASGESGETPGWLKRVEFSTQVETDKKPTFSLETVQPLYQDESKVNTVFIQPRVNLRDERTLYNLGFGYRRLVSENLILGLNTFGDYQDKSRHGRVGVGFEALGQVLEARLNSYFGGVSSKSNIHETGAGLTVEQVVDGMDLELGAPLPYLPWLKMYGGGSWYDFKKFTDKVEWKSRLEARLNEYTRVEVYAWDDNKGEMEYGGRLRFNVAFHAWTDITKAFKFAKEIFPAKDLTEELLIPVERHHEIVVEQYTESGGLVIEAGRGNS